MIIQEGLTNKGLNGLNGFYSDIILFSNIILSLVFFLLAYHLIKCSEIFEPQNKNLKIKLGKVHRKVEYGSLVLVLLSVGFLFNIIPIFLCFSLDSLPNSPFLDILGPFWGYEDLHNKDLSLSELKSLDSRGRFLYLTAACCCLLSFTASLIGLYFAIYRKIVIDTKIKGFIAFILFMGLSVFFGIPLVMNLIAKQGIYLNA